MRIVPSWGQRDDALGAIGNCFGFEVQQWFGGKQNVRLRYPSGGRLTAVP